jgi:histidyl-tRNA synthetase
MVEDKGLDPAVADKIGEYVKYKGGNEIVEQLQAIPEVMENASAKQGLEEMALLCSYLGIYDVLPVLSIDMSLARGLDYYTGVIYEIVTEGSAPSAPAPDVAKKEKKQKKSADPDEDRSNDPTIGVGSVAAGGRYDELVGMFSGKPIPCVGISFGVDRIFSITKERLKADEFRATEIDVFIIALGMGKDFTGLLPERMQMAKTLWDAGIKAEFQWKTKPKYQKQFEKAEQGKVPWAIIFGDDELKEGQVKIKDLSQGKDYEGPDKQGVLVSRDNLVQEMRDRLAGKKASGESSLPDRTAL